MRSSHRGQSTASHRPTRPQAAPHRLQLPQAPLTPPHTPVQVVSEYGTHWNFFFTLALVAAAAAVATPASARATALCAAALLLLHQAALLCGLAQWVEHAPRRGLLSANKVWRAPAPPQPRALPEQPARARVLSLTSLLPAARGRRQEGLASLPGYLAVWWLGDAIGAVLRPRAAARSWWRALAELGLLTLVLGAGAPRTPPPRARLAPPPTRAVALTPGLAPLCRLLCAASFIADAAVQRASRRLCNLAYSLWVVAQARRAPEPSCTPARPAAVPARHRPSWCCASVSQRASSVQHQLRTSWAR